MIVFQNAVEPTVAKATSTYPAIITNVGYTTDVFVSLSFYCPSIVSGQPYQAAYANLYNSIVQAPIKPHNGADNYDFKRGGVIIISFADGNLNSPQFVRFVEVSDRVRERNEDYLNGEAVLPERIFSIYDNVADDILVKSKSLLRYVQICAKGKANDPYSIITDFNNLNGNVIPIYKCGRYGVELISTKKLFDKSFALEYFGTDERNQLEVPEITFLSICKYFNNNVFNPKNTTIIDVFTSAYEKKTGTTSPVIQKNESMALRLFANIAGSIDAELINSTLAKKENYDSESELPKGVSIPFSEMYYNYKALDLNYIRNTWNQFENYYFSQIDRAYAIIIHNNLFRLRSAWNLQVNNVMLIITAVVISAYQLIEQAVLRGSNAIKDLDGISADSVDFLDTIKKIARNNSIKNSVDIRSQKSYLSRGFLRLYYNMLGKGRTWSNNTMYNNIQLGIEAIADNLNSILGVLSQNIEDTTSASGSTITGSSDSSRGLINNYLWPTPKYKIITSPFGYRDYVKDKDGNIISGGAGKPHHGIDIGAANKSEILAAESGTIEITHWSGYGNQIWVNHGNGYKTLYAHCSSLVAKQGDKVSRGDLIAYVGSTGNSTGPHLHFGVYFYNGSSKKWEWVNPLR
nr:metallo-endopeptidase [uncultured phage]CAI9752111.1 metallo-endopeptidase [uncultured phage]